MNQSSQADDLAQFRKRLEERVRSSQREPNWPPADMATEMQRFQDRKLEFERIAPHLLTETVLPRLSHLASLFTNANLGAQATDDRITCWFGYCERFPATAKIEITASHDAAIENVVVRFEASIFPSYQRFEPHDKLVIPLSQPNDVQVAQWVEDRLVEFLDAYLRIDHGIEDFDDEIVTDPVCGMRLARGRAAATADFRGHPYFFCAAECQQQFLQEPAKFIVFRGQ
jgi:YHS domain-containing protein